MKYRILGIIAVLLAGPVFGQSEGSRPKPHYFLGAHYDIGTVLPTNDFLKGENAEGVPYDAYHAISIEWGKQTAGDREWEQANLNPAFGLGVYMMDFLKGGDELGNPVALYGFLKAPFKRWRRSALLYDVQFGLSWNFNPFSPELNPLNIAIGSYMNAYIQIGSVYTYNFSPRWVGIVGISAVHFSNGASSLPNNGINQIGARLGVRYNMYTDEIDYSKKELGDWDKKTEFQYSFSAGTRNVRFDSTDEQQTQTYFNQSYFMANADFLITRHITRGFKAGGGIDINYDGALEAQSAVAQRDTTVSLQTSDQMAVGLLGHAEGTLGDFSFMVGLGYEILRKDVPGRADPFFQRLGAKMHFGKNKNTFGGILIRFAQFSRARYIEWMIGRRIRW